MTTRPTEHFLKGEGQRNRHNAALYVALLNKAWGACEVIVGHHINFEFDNNLDTEDEIPSADCLLFNHHVMEAVFGHDAQFLMQMIAGLKPYQREEAVCEEWNRRFPSEQITLPRGLDQ